jgi:hypothetical protein
VLTADSRLGIYDASNNRIAVGMPDPANNKRAFATLDPALTSGTYTVKSTSISADDGDLDRQQWTFTVNVPASAASPSAQATGSLEPSPSAAASPSAAVSPAPSPTASHPPDTSTTSGSDAIVPILAALALVAVGGLLLMSRGRRGGARP